MKHLLLSLIISTTLSISAIGQNAGNCLNFDGTNDYVTSTVPTLFSDLTQNSFTMECWVNPSAVGFSRVLFAQSTGTMFANISYASDNTIYFYVGDGTQQSIQTNNTIPLNTWTHVAVTWDHTTSTQEVYFNGVLQAGGGGGTSTTGTNGLFAIGSRPDGNQYFNGDIDEVRVWNEVLTQCEIQNRMEYTVDPATTGLVLYYRFNEGTAGGTNTGVTTLPDQTATANDGSLLNFGLTGTTSNWIASNATILGLYSGGGAMYSETDTICNGDSLLFDGIYLDQTGQFTGVFQDQNGCDSTVVLDLIVFQPDTSLNVNGNVLEAAAQLDSYQWLDCDASFATINGETSQTYTATQAGNYAVEISAAGCTDTTRCEMPVFVSVDELTASNVSIYPNPTTGLTQVQISGYSGLIDLEVLDINGRVITSDRVASTEIIEIDLREESHGVYFVRLQTENNVMTLKVVKN